MFLPGDNNIRGYMDIPIVDLNFVFSNECPLVFFVSLILYCYFSFFLVLKVVDKELS